MKNPEQDMAADLLQGTLIMLVVSNAIFGGLIALMFYLGGFFHVVSWVIVAGLALWDWRGLRHVVKLMRGDTSL